MAVYSRDLAAKALRDLDEVLRAIRDGVFLPDSSRSGYFVQKPVQSERTDPLLQPSAKRKVAPRAVVASDGLEPASSSDPHSDSESSTSSSSSSEASDPGLGLDEDLAKDSGEQARLASGSGEATVFQHTVYGTLHLQHAVTATKLSCGRDVVPRYRELTGLTNVDWPRCSTCFGNRGNDNS